MWWLVVMVVVVVVAEVMAVVIFCGGGCAGDVGRGLSAVFGSGRPSVPPSRRRQN